MKRTIVEGRKAPILGLFLLLGGGLALLAQNRFAGVEVSATLVAGNVHLLEGRGGNIGVSVGDDGVVMVDSQFAPLAPKIRAAVEELGGGELRFLINTHHHGDHTGGNAVFGKEAAIVAHESVRRRLAGDAEEDAPGARDALPVVTYAEGLSLHLNGEEIRVLHLPKGHTDGDSVVFFTGANVVHMGDLFFSGRFPFVDLDSGGDVEGYLRNVETVIERVPADVKIIPGHGPLSTLEDLKLFRRMLQETIESVRTKTRAGQTTEEIQSEGLAPEWDAWGKHFISTDRWIETIVRSISRG